MSGRTSIEWTEATWNPVRGCSRVSEGCRHCYAERIAARFSGPGQPYEGLARWTDSVLASAGAAPEPRWTGEVRLVPERLADPLRWRKPRRIFVNSMSDLFHERLSFEAIAAVFGIMAATPQHTFQVLTKRPELALKFSRWLTAGDVDHVERRTCQLALLRQWDRGRQPRAVLHAVQRSEAEALSWPLPNVWLGVSVEDQATADQRIPALMQCPAAVRWISYEPALGPLDLDGGIYDGPGWLRGWHTEARRDQRGDPEPEQVQNAALDWVVAGGESGPGARPARPQWFRDVRDQCAADGIPFLFKQWGHHDAQGRAVGKKAAGRLLDGALHDAYPEVAP